MPSSEKEVWRKLIEDYKIKFPYDEEKFYKTHKISRKDFIEKLEASKTHEEKDQIIMKLYEDESIKGRRGVLPLEESLRIIRGKIEDKERFMKFA